MNKLLYNPRTSKMEERQVAVATYSNKAACACGFTALRDDVPFGKKYRVVVDSVKESTYKCGGCKNEYTVPAILAEESHGPYDFYLALPLAIFNPKEEWEYQLCQNARGISGYNGRVWMELPRDGNLALIISRLEMTHPPERGVTGKKSAIALGLVVDDKQSDVSSRCFLAA